MSPGMQDFLQESLVQNRFTEEIDNVKWPIKKKVVVLGRFDTVTTLEDTESKLAINEDEETLQFKEIETKLVPI
jgi:hypothetical protein